MEPENRIKIGTCPCCKVCKNCLGFQKMVGRPNSGFIFYRHTAHVEDINKSTGVVEATTETIDDVFILENKQDAALESMHSPPDTDRNLISCPRCLNILKHTQSLSKSKEIGDNDIIGVCEHCRMKGQGRIDEIAENFQLNKNERRRTRLEHVKTWLSKVKQLITLALDEEKGKKTDSSMRRGHSDIDVRQLYRKFPKTDTDHEPEIEDLFLPYISGLQSAIRGPVSERSYFQGASKEVAFKEPNEIELIYGSPQGGPSQPLLLSQSNATLTEDELEKDLIQKYGKSFKEKRSFKDPTPTVRYVDERYNEFVPPAGTRDDGEGVGPEYKLRDIHTKKIERGHAGEKHYEDEKIADSDSRPEGTRKKESIRESDSRHEGGKMKELVVRDSKHSKDGKILSETPTHLKKYKSSESLIAGISKMKDETKKHKTFELFFPQKPGARKKEPKVENDLSAEFIKDTIDKLKSKTEEQKDKREKVGKIKERSTKLEDEKERGKSKERDMESEQGYMSKKDQDVSKKNRDTNKRERDMSKEDLDASKKEQSASKKEKDALKKDQDASKKETDALKKDQDVSKKEKNVLKTDQDASKKEKDALKKDQDASRKEKDALKKEQDESKKERDALKKDQDAYKKERDALKKDLDASKKERDALKKEQDASKKERDANKKNLDVMTKEKIEKGKDSKSKDEDQLKEDKVKGKDRSKEEKKNKEQINNTEKKDGVGNDKEVKTKEGIASKQMQVTNKRDPQAEKLLKELEQEAKEREKLKNELKQQKEERRLKLNAEQKAKEAANLDMKKEKRTEQSKKVGSAKSHDKIGPETNVQNLSPLQINMHSRHGNIKHRDCALCNNSDLELDLQNIMREKQDKKNVGMEVIFGERIHTFKTQMPEPQVEKGIKPILFQKQIEIFGQEIGSSQLDRSPRPEKEVKLKKDVDQEHGKGIVRYALSDRTFIEKGWTMLPTEKVVRKMNVYRMRPAHPEFDWFEHNKKKGMLEYDTGEKLAEFDDNGRGRWYYRNGKLALDYYDAEELNAQQRVVVYSSGEPDERGRTYPRTVLATFDYLGNGCVFDHTGKIRLKYNQTEGVVLDRSLGPVSHWKWHTLNDPPVLQQVMIDTQMAHKDPQILKLGGPGENKPRLDDEEMLAIEFDNFIKEKSAKLSQSFKPFQIKMKALKINEYFSLRVLDQATVYLLYRDGSTNIKLNIGMLLDHKEIVDTDTAEVGEVSINVERLPARTDSLAELQRNVANAQRIERYRSERERRLRRPEPCASADRLTAAASRPLKPPLRTVDSASTVGGTKLQCKCRKPTPDNVYYDTSLI